MSSDEFKMFRADLIRKVKAFQHQAGDYHKAAASKTGRMQEELRPHLTADEMMALSIAVGHVLTGEGRGELDDVCLGIRERLGERVERR